MPTLAALTDRVHDLLAEHDPSVEPNAEGIWRLRFGSTLLVVSVFEDEGRGYVRMASLLLHGVRPQLELLTRLLRLNTQVCFGAFQLFEDDTLAFTHTLAAEPLDPEGFRHALAYVARVGDEHDEELQALAGGARVEDLLEES